MKFVEPSRFTDPDAAARKLVEIANAIEPAQDGRIYIELVNAAFLGAGSMPQEFGAGIQRAIDKGWLTRHESGTYAIDVVSQKDLLFRFDERGFGGLSR